MQVIYHLGAHCTDEDRLYRCLLKNKGELAREGIVVSGPGRYRPILREALSSLRGSVASPDLQQTILDAVLDMESAERIVFSNEQFISSYNAVLADNRLYPKAGMKAGWIANIFPEAETGFAIGIRNPATFLPSLFNRADDQDDFLNFMGDVEPIELRWSDTIAEIAAAVPGAPLYVWCNEDTPLIWPEVLQTISGHAPNKKLKGVNDFLATIMTKEGVSRMETYMLSHPPKTIQQRVRIVSAFLDKYAIPDEVEMELDVPGWTEDLVDHLTASYEEDCQRIQTMPGVTFIAP